MNTATTDCATERDRLFFQQERDRVTAVYEMWVEAGELAEAMYTRLDEFDELDEAITFEETGGGIRHGYSGEPLPWLQQRRGEARARLAGLTKDLASAAQELEAAAQATSQSGRLDHIARGFTALAAEASRVVESFRPGREPAQVDWPRVYAICDGIRHLDDLQDREFRAEVLHDLSKHDRNREGLLALGMADYVAAEIDGDPVLQRALRAMRRFVGEVVDGQLY